MNLLETQTVQDLAQRAIKMIYLSLDQALQTTGYAIFDEDSLIEYGHFTIPANKKIEVRLNAIMQELSELENRFEFQDVFFEDIQAQQNKETYKKLAYVQAAVLIWCYNTEHKTTILAPSHWRSVLKNKYKISFGKARQEQKKAAQELVRQRFGIQASEDECDAICIGLAGIQERKQTTSAF